MNNVTSLTSALTNFRTASEDVYDFRSRVDSFVVRLMSEPEAAREKTLAALTATGDPALAALASQLGRALAGDAKTTIARAAGSFVKTIETHDPAPLPKAFVDGQQAKALAQGIGASTGSAAAARKLAIEISAELPASYKKTFASEREAIMAVLDELGRDNAASVYALVAINARAAQAHVAGDKAGARALMKQAQASAEAKDIPGLVKVGERVVQELAVRVPAARLVRGEVTLGAPPKLSDEAVTQARREIRAGADGTIFPRLTGNNCGTHGYVVTGEAAKSLLSMARARGDAPIDTKGFAVLALLDTAPECAITMALVDAKGHVVRAGECSFDTLTEYAEKTLPSMEYPDGFQGAYELLKGAEYFGLGPKGRPVESFDIEQFNTAK